MDQSRLQKLIRRRARVLVAATIVAGLSGFAIARLQKPIYEAEVQLLVGPVYGDYQALRASGSLAKTYAELVQRTPVLQAAARRARTDIDIEAFRESVQPRASDLTRILSIRVRNGNPRTAAALANGLAAELGTQAELLRVIESAEVPVEAASPNAQLIVPLASLVGLVGALLVTIGVEATSGRLRDTDDLEALTGAPCIPVSHGRPRLRPTRDAGSAPTIPFELAAAAVDGRDGLPPARAIAVVPTTADGFGAEVAFGLAAAIGSAGHDVVLVDAAPEQILTRWLGLVGQPGINDAFADHESAPAQSSVGLLPNDSTTETPQINPADSGRATTLIRTLRRTVELPGLTVISAGTPTGAQKDAANIARVLRRVLVDASRVVLITGSAGVDNEALRWVRASDVALLVATAGLTRRADVSEITRTLQLSGVRLAATVLQDRP